MHILWNFKILHFRDIERKIELCTAVLVLCGVLNVRGAEVRFGERGVKMKVRESEARL